MSNIILHSGAHAADWDQVVGSHTPSPTDTHYPIPHAALVQTVERHVEAVGWTVQRREFGMWGDQENPNARMFGVLALAPTDPADVVQDDYGMVVGVRNSHDKRFAAGVAAGARVFVCDNLSFSGEVVINRKHTSRILDDLDRLIAAAIGQLSAMRVRQDERIAAYKSHQLTDAEVHDIVIRSVDARAMATSYIPKVLDCWRNPRHDDFRDRTAWSLWNAYTEVFKAVNPLTLTGRTMGLHGLFDMLTGVGAIQTDVEYDVVGEDTDVRGLIGYPATN